MGQRKVIDKGLERYERGWIALSALDLRKMRASDTNDGSDAIEGFPS